MTDDLNSMTPQAVAMTAALDILRNAGLDAKLDIVDKDNCRIDIKLDAQAPVPYDTLLTSFKHALYACLHAIQRHIAIETARMRR